MKITKIYELNQTVGEKRTINYNLCENTIENQVIYGIEIVSFSEDKKEVEKIENVSCEKDKVMNIITLLYENAVDITHFKDVVEDYISAL